MIGGNGNTKNNEIQMAAITGINHNSATRVGTAAARVLDLSSERSLLEVPELTPVNYSEQTLAQVIQKLSMLEPGLQFGALGYPTIEFASTRIAALLRLQTAIQKLETFNSAGTRVADGLSNIENDIQMDYKIYLEWKRQY